MSASFDVAKCGNVMKKNSPIHNCTESNPSANQCSKTERNFVMPNFLGEKQSIVSIELPPFAKYEPRCEKTGLGVSDTNQALQPHKMDRCSKFRIKKVEGLYFLCIENKGADQLRGYREADLPLCFRICKKPVFSRRGSYDIYVGSYWHENI